VALLADDPIGAGRERTDLEPYLAAFALIEQDPNQLLLVAESGRREVAATLQVSFLPGLSRGGMLRAQLEGVRVAAAHRGAGLGSALLERAEALAEQRGAGLVQLTSDLRRSAAIRFYEAAGYRHSHAGLKRDLPR
jgi:GNAT superfamily N-acetyltransferase